MEQEKNVLDRFVKAVGENENNAINVAKKVLENGKEDVTINLQQTKVMPERIESPARAHIFHDAEGFIKYLKDNRTQTTLVLADIDNVRVCAVLDDKAKTGFETINLCPPLHPKFALLEETLLNKKMPITEFARAVMRNRAIIKDTALMSAKDLAMAMQQITVASETTQSIGTGKIAVNGVVCKTKISAGTAEEKIELPDSFGVEVPIYLNTKDKQFGVDITVSTIRGEIVVDVDCPELKVKKFEVFEEILDPIKQLKNVCVSYGKLQTVNWKYND